MKPEGQSNVDQRVFILKLKVQNWLKDAEDEYDNKSKSSGRSSKGRSPKDHQDQAKLQVQDHQRLIL